MVKKTTMEERQNELEHRLQDLRMEWRNQRKELRQWLERIERHSRRQRGSSRHSRRSREECSETVEPATVHIAMRKSEEVEVKMEKSLGNLKWQFTDVAKSAKHVDDELGTQQQKIEIAAVAGDFHALPPEPPEPPDRYVFSAKVWEFHDSSAQLSNENDCGVAEWPLEEVKWDEEPSPTESPPEEVSPELRLSSELEPPIAMGAVTKEKDEEVGGGCVTERVVKRVRIGWDPKLLDLMGKCLGQAQNLLFTPPQVNNRECELEIMVGSDKNNKVVWSGLNMGLTSHSMGQAQDDQVSKSEFYMGREVFTVKTKKKRELFGLGMSQKQMNFFFGPPPS